MRISKHRLTLITLLSVSIIGCGYQLAGRGSFLPEYIETIGIPMFENETSVFEIEQLLTEQVRQEFIGRGRYRVIAGELGVDGILNGVIRDITISPASFTADQQATRYVFTLTASIVFLDMTTQEILWENPRMVFSDEYEVATGDGSVESVSSFFGQRSNAVIRVATDFSEAVVSAILEAF